MKNLLYGGDAQPTSYSRSSDAFGSSNKGGDAKPATYNRNKAGSGNIISWN